MRTSCSTGRWSSSGRSDEAVHSQRALELYDELGKLGPQATIYNNLGMFAWLRGRWDEAVELFDKGRQLRLRIGDEVDAATGTLNIAEVLSDQGRLDEARPLFEESLRVWRAADFGIGVAYVDQQPRHASPAGSGDFERAAELYDAAARAVPRRWCQSHELIDTDARIAEALVFQGRSRRGDRAGVGRARADGSPRRRHPGPDAPPHPRLRAGADRRSRPAPSDELRGSLEAGRARNARYEVALTLDAIARVAEAGGRLDAPARAEADELFAALGVVFVPTVPLDRLAVTAAG